MTKIIYKTNCTLGIAAVGAIGKSIGATAPSAKETTFARGFRFRALTKSPVASMSAAAPSFKVDAFPAVTVPFSF